MLLQLSHFPPDIPLQPAHTLPPTSPPALYFVSVGHTYKFFGFYISYTILTLPLSIFYLPFMLLIPCTFPPPPLHLPLITLHVISISVILFLFQLFAQFAFVFVLAVVVNNCEFAVIFTVHIFLYSFSQVTPFNISYNNGLVMMNSFNLTLLGKHFTLPF